MEKEWVVDVVGTLLRFGAEIWLPFQSKPIRYVEKGMDFDFRDFSERFRHWSWKMSESKTVAVTPGLRELQSLSISSFPPFHFTFGSLVSLCSLVKIFISRAIAVQQEIQQENNNMFIFL